ncbi:MAG: RsmE family RNA methyltransferase [Acidimicrobiia bacterium]
METGWAAEFGASALVLRDRAVGGFEPSDADADSLVIDGADGHHLQRVRRLAVGETILIADGSGDWYPSQVVEVGDGTLTVSRAGPIRTEPRPTPRITVAFAPAKRDHGAEVVRHLVELGVDRLIPLIARRGVVRWDGARGDKAWTRLSHAIRDAALQSHRALLPVLDRPVDVGRLAKEPGLLVADRTGIPIPELVPGSVDEWVVLIGPEGGFDRAEHTVLESAIRVRVGPHILRSVTAPVAVAAALVSLRPV